MRSLISVAAVFGLLALFLPTQASATGSPDGLVCRAKSSSEGTYELVLHWQGSTAKGALRQIAPSGNVTEQTVRAERQGSTIIADSIWEKDLAVHAAIVAEKSGKKYMRAGTDGAWRACE